MTIANVLTVSRLFAVPIMLLSAWWQRPGLFAGLFAYALASDVVDGTIARRLGPTTTLGARLDSIADAAVYLTAPAAALVLYPVLREREWITLLMVFGAYIVPIAVGYAKFRRLTSYHTFAARSAGVLLGVAFVLFVALGFTWPLRVATAVLLLSAVEEIAITGLLPQWHANVPSLVHAIRLKNVATMWGGGASPKPASRGESRRAPTSD